MKLYKMLHNENVQSGISYFVGGVPVGASLTHYKFDAALHSAALIAQDVAVVLGCLVVLVRLMYDFTRFVRYIIAPKENKDE